MSTAPGLARAPDKGRQSASGATHGAVDTQQVDVPAHDEQGVHGSHENRITRIPAQCPGSVRHPDGSGSVRCHIWANMASGGLIPVNVGLFPSIQLPEFSPFLIGLHGRYPWRSQLRGLGSLADSGGG
jgi:hypothetical protein